MSAFNFSVPGEFRKKLTYKVMMISIGILIGGMALIVFRIRSEREEKGNQLKAIGVLKIDQLVQWRNERLSECRFFASNTIVADLLKLTENVSDTSLLNRMSHLSEPFLNPWRYNNIVIFSPGLRVRYSASGEPFSIDPALAERLEGLERPGNTLLADFYYNHISGRTTFELLSTVHDSSHNLLGIIMLTCNPETYLFPLVQSWPIPSKSSENILLKRSGDSALVINRLRHYSNSPMNFLIPLTNRKLTVSKAVSGQHGLQYGRNYKGQKVLAYVDSVPQTEWLLVTEVNQNEIYNRLIVELILISFVLVLLIVMTILLLKLRNKAREENLMADLLVSKENEKAALLENARISEENNRAIIKLNEDLENQVIERTRKLRITEGNYREIFEKSPVSILKEDWSVVISEVNRLKALGIESFSSYFDKHPEFVLNAISNIGILEVNDSAMKLLGFSSRDQISKSLDGIISSPDVIMGFREELLALCNNADAFEMDTVRRKIDSSLVHVLLRMVFPTEQSDPGIVLVTLTDISQQKRINEDLEFSKLQLEMVNRELESFSYSVSHDLRAPLRAIHGYIRILQETYREKLDSEGIRLSKLVEGNAVQMSQLIDDLLRISKVTKIDMNYSTINMEDLFARVYNELTSGMNKARIRFTCGQLPSGRGDEVLLKQVITNLLSNALKYTSRKDVAVIEAGCEQRDSENVYFIKDNGAGFDLKYAGKLFGLFQRLHSVNEFDGNGIGLAIVKRIITRHGGNVWAEAEPGTGATFYFSIPRG